MKVPVVSFLLIAIVGLLDFITGTDISLSLFYLLPVTLCSWCVNRKISLVAALLCGLAALVSDAASGRHLPVVFWNTAVRTSIFILVALLLSALKHSQNKLRLNEETLKQT